MIKKKIAYTNLKDTDLKKLNPQMYVFVRLEFAPLNFTLFSLVF